MNSIINSLENSLLRIAKSENSYWLFICIWAFLLFILFPLSTDGNEEHYLQLGLLRVRPELFSEYHSVFEQGLTRFLYEYITGHTVLIFGYDGTFILSRILNASLYSLAITLFFSRLKINAIEALAVLSLFILAGQELFGGEWLFRSVEPKTYAYIFIFFAFYFWLGDRWPAVIFYLVFATYFHFLVGLFWAAFIFTTHLINQRDLVSTIKNGLSYSALVLPLVVVIYTSSFNGNPNNYHLTADYIYGAIRLPHHVSPFASMSGFLNVWLKGLALLPFIIWMALHLRKQRPLKDLATLIIISALFLILSFIVSYIDKDSHALAKFFLFRPSSITLLLTILCVICYTKQLWAGNSQKVYLILLAVAPLLVAYDHAKKFTNVERSLFTLELNRVVEHHIDPKDIVLIEPYFGPEDNYIAVHRLIGRPTLIETKFIPSSTSDIIMWHQRLTFREKFLTQGCDRAVPEFSINFILVYSAEVLNRFTPCSEILYKDGTVSLLKLTSSNH